MIWRLAEQIQSSIGSHAEGRVTRTELTGTGEVPVHRWTLTHGENSSPDFKAFQLIQSAHAVMQENLFKVS